MIEMTCGTRKPVPLACQLLKRKRENKTFISAYRAGAQIADDELSAIHARIAVLGQRSKKMEQIYDKGLTSPSGLGGGLTTFTRRERCSRVSVGGDSGGGELISTSLPERDA